MGSEGARGVGGRKGVERRRRGLKALAPGGPGRSLARGDRWHGPAGGLGEEIWWSRRRRGDSEVEVERWGRRVKRGEEGCVFPYPDNLNIWVRRGRSQLFSR